MTSLFNKCDDHNTALSKEKDELSHISGPEWVVGSKPVFTCEWKARLSDWEYWHLSWAALSLKKLAEVFSLLTTHLTIDNWQQWEQTKGIHGRPRLKDVVPKRCELLWSTLDCSRYLPPLLISYLRQLTGPSPENKPSMLGVQKILLFWTPGIRIVAEWFNLPPPPPT